MLTGSAGLEVGEVVLEPSDVDNIKMVSRLIEKEDVRLEEHSAGKGELHLPTTRKAADSLSLAFIGETDGGEGLDDLLTSSLNTLVADDELEDRGVFLGSIDVVLDVESADLIRGGETFNLAIGDGAHEGRLSGTVLTAETVAVATLEAEGSGVEQDLGTISERELAVAKIFTLLLVLGDLVVVNTLGSGANDPLASDGDGVGGGGNEGEVGSKGVPLRNVKVLGVEEVGGKVGGVHCVDISSGDSGAELLVDGDEGVGELLLVSVVERVEVGAIAVGGDLANLTEGGDGSANDAASFGVTDGSLNLDQAREKLGNEGSDSDMRVDELGHVVNDAKNIKISNRVPPATER